jgi:hypothetical protein
MQPAGSGMRAAMSWDSVSIAPNSFALFSGVFLLVYGADLFVVNTAVLARRLGVSETFIALLTVEGEWEEVCAPSPMAMTMTICHPLTHISSQS